MGAGRLSYKRVLVFKNSVLKRPKNDIEVPWTTQASLSGSCSFACVCRSIFLQVPKGGLHLRVLLASVDGVRCPILS